MRSGRPRTGDGLGLRIAECSATGECGRDDRAPVMDQLESPAEPAGLSQSASVSLHNGGSNEVEGSRDGASVLGKRPGG